ncbi:MAG: STAS domain-containing protein [bacterium]|jgi:anti-sigma B factor antagonist|nr:STAS domain-containing protein [Spirochaetales bacterium]MDT3390613.1 STAS domain-containing protein [bacterium]
MLNIEKKVDGKNIEMVLSGRIDTTTAPELDKAIQEVIGGAENLVFNFADIDYISSAGLRVLLTSQKTMNKQGSMKVTHVNESVMEIFEVTGFSEILSIE